MRFIIALCLLSCCTDRLVEYPVSEKTKQLEITSEFINSFESKQATYVVLVSIDGFRYDYAKRYGAENLLSFGVRAEGLIPSFPSKTFPNHYSIVTGLYPGNHGLVSNSFYDRKIGRAYDIRNRDEVEKSIWYYGKPLWTLAREQGMVTASMMWVGTEAPIYGYHPTYYYKYNSQISHEDRVNTVVNWLMLPEEKRPHFITLYFSDTDNIGHKFGPDSKEIADCVLTMDGIIGDLLMKLKTTDLPVQLIVVSDHGMKSFDTENLIRLSELIPEAGESTVITKSMPTMIYSSDSSYLNECYQILSHDERLEVYRMGQWPENFYYSTHSRIGDLIIIPKPGFQISEAKEMSPGSSTHGYAPFSTTEMQGIFYAKGSVFLPDIEIAPFENVHIYPLIANILGLNFDKNSIDGNTEVLKPVLK